jgi:N-methylhydantoinase A
MPSSIPVIDMVEIGAGGGSLAHVDSMQQIRVGPESAGSEPGPACYGQGGTRPSVTDADLILGKLDPENFAGGSIKLHQDNSKIALAKHVGDTLEMDAVEAAFGVAEVVDENMANAARVHAVENGEDLSEYTMIAFGGAAPLHAARLCEKLGVERLLVPSGAGVGSAIGFLRAPFSFEANRSVYMKLSDFDAEKIKVLLTDLRDEATGFVRTCDEASQILSEFKVYMRYTGQGWEIPIPLQEGQAMNPDAATFESRFKEEYTKLFGRPVAGMDIEITVWSVNATTPQKQVPLIPQTDGNATAVSNGTRHVFDAAVGTHLKANVIDRGAMTAGQRANGPAVLAEAETTIIVPVSRDAICQTDGCIDVVKKGTA